MLFQESNQGLKWTDPVMFRGDIMSRSTTVSEKIWSECALRLRAKSRGLLRFLDFELVSLRDYLCQKINLQGVLFDEPLQIVTIPHDGCTPLYVTYCSPQARSHGFRFFFFRDAGLIPLVKRERSGWLILLKLACWVPV